MLFFSFLFFWVEVEVEVEVDCCYSVFVDGEGEGQEEGQGQDSFLPGNGRWELGMEDDKRTGRIGGRYKLRGRVGYHVIFGLKWINTVGKGYPNQRP